MKRIALQLLLSLALIFQGVSAFGASFAYPSCCGHGAQAEHGHCHHGHGTPCKPNCAQHCIGCATTVFFAIPSFVTILPAASIAVPSLARATKHARYDLPPTRPPIV